MKVHFELMKCINDQLTRAKHASRSAARRLASKNDRAKCPVALYISFYSIFPPSR